ncbi:MAG: hypothetical protein AAGF47_00625 [Planctomycetota bacterium]
MSPHDLLESALLDACGLLESHEIAAFERDFAAASPEQRAEIRREQARFADVADMLPDVTPRAELRAEVIEAVREAMGQNRDRAGLAFLHEGEPGRAAGESATRHRRSVSPWRVAAFGFGTAAVVLGVLSVQLQAEFSRMQEQVTTGEARQFFLNTSPNTAFRPAVLGTSHDRVALSPVTAQATEAEAAVFFDAEGQTAHAAYFRLPPLAEGETYVIVQLGDDDRVLNTVASFASNGDLGSVRFAYDPSMGSRFAIGTQSGTSVTLMMTSA